MNREDLRRANPMCWRCGRFQQPVSPYQPLICADCLPAHRQAKFAFVRPSQQEMEKLFTTERGMTCQ